MSRVRIRCQTLTSDPNRESVIVLWINNHKTVFPVNAWHEVVDRICYAGDKADQQAAQHDAAQRGNVAALNAQARTYGGDA